jgi:hypothetical protein
MRRKKIPKAIRRLVRERANGRCEYCQHPDKYDPSPFVCDHVTPFVIGAGNTLSELAWACAGCNNHKYNKTHALDPQTGRLVPLFNPRRQKWSRHFTWSSDSLMIVAHTATGRATIEALHLNRAELINVRRLMVIAGEHPAQNS